MEMSDEGKKTLGAHRGHSGTPMTLWILAICDGGHAEAQGAGVKGEGMSRSIDQREICFQTLPVPGTCRTLGPLQALPHPPL